MSERRACKAIGFCRMTVRYETRRDDDHELRERMKALAHERRRFGYRRIHVLLRREGHLVNHKRLFRLYREEKLTVRKRGGRKRAIGTRAPILVPMVANDRKGQQMAGVRQRPSTPSAGCRGFNQDQIYYVALVNLVSERSVVLNQTTNRVSFPV